MIVLILEVFSNLNVSMILWYKESIICQHIHRTVSDWNNDEEVSQLNAGFLIVAQPLMADRTKA